MSKDLNTFLVFFHMSGCDQVFTSEKKSLTAYERYFPRLIPRVIDGQSPEVPWTDGQPFSFLRISFDMSHQGEY